MRLFGFVVDLEVPRHLPGRDRDLRQGTQCNDIITVTAAADYGNLKSSFTTPRTNSGGITC